MPSRLGVALVVLFWAATTAVVVYRDVVPRYFSDDAPTLGIEMTDEAATQIPARWSLHRDTPDGPKKVGVLNTRLDYDPADDTFWFRSEYSGLRFDFARPGVTGLVVEMPKVLSNVRVTRPGALREQRFFAEVRASMVVPLPGLEPVKTPLAGMAVAVDGRVTGGTLTGTCQAWFPYTPSAVRDKPARPDTPPTFDRPLDPVPVTDGQVLNPMMPVARLRDVRPGRRWVIKELDPMKEAVGTLVREAAKGSGELRLFVPPAADGPRELIAEVRSEPVELVSQKARIPGTDPERFPCWVIDYTEVGNSDVRAATWVAVANGRVLRQEASGLGEKLRFERED